MAKRGVRRRRASTRRPAPVRKRKLVSASAQAPPRPAPVAARLRAIGERALRSRDVWACAGLVAFTLLFYGRLTRSLGSPWWPNDLLDGAMTAWNLWHAPHRLLHGQDPLHTDMVFFPEGTPLALHTYAPLIGIVTWPMAQLVGLPITYTLVTLAGPALSAIGTYFLVMDRLGNRWLSFYAGAAYAMLPDRVLRMGGHMNLNQTWVLPIALFFLFRFYDRPTPRRAVALGLATGLSLYVESIFTSFLAIAFLVVMAVEWRRTAQRPYLIGWAHAIAVGSAVALPVLLSVAGQVVRGETDPLPGWGAADSGSADVLSYVIPAEFHPLWKDTPLAKVYSQVTAGERFTFVGWSLLALAIVGGIVWRDRRKRSLVALALTFVILSLGPFLHVNNHQGDFFELHGTRFNVPLPYLLIHLTPGLNELRIPARFGLMAGLLLAVLAAGGLQWVVERVKRRHRFPARIAPAFAMAAVAVLAVECLPGPVPLMGPTAIPAPYDAIAADPGRRAVLELPLQWRDGHSKTGDQPRDDTLFMYYAAHHGKPISGGMVARFPDAREARMRELPVYRDVLALQDGLPPENATFTAADLWEMGIGYVVAHRDRPVPNAFEYVQRMGMPVLADDGNTIVWRVPPA